VTDVQGTVHDNVAYRRSSKTLHGESRMQEIYCTGPKGGISSQYRLGRH